MGDADARHAPAGARCRRRRRAPHAARERCRVPPRRPDGRRDPRGHSRGRRGVGGRTGARHVARVTGRRRAHACRPASRAIRRTPSGRPNSCTRRAGRSTRHGPTGATGSSSRPKRPAESSVPRFRASGPGAVLRVGTERTARPAQLGGCTAQTRGRALLHDPADYREHVARAHVRVLQELAHRVDGGDCRVARPRTAASTSCDDRAPIHSATAASSSSRCAARPSNVAKRASSPRPSSVEHSVRDGFRRSGDRHPLAVRAPICAARHGVRDAGAEPGLVVIEVRGGRRQRRHHLHHRLEQVDVDHLPLAALRRAHATRPSPRTRPRVPPLRR